MIYTVWVILFCSVFLAEIKSCYVSSPPSSLLTHVLLLTFLLQNQLSVLWSGEQMCSLVVVQTVNVLRLDSFGAKPEKR